MAPAKHSIEYKMFFRCTERQAINGMSSKLPVMSLLLMTEENLHNDKNRKIQVTKVNKKTTVAMTPNTTEPVVLVNRRQKPLSSSKHLQHQNNTAASTIVHQ